MTRPRVHLVLRRPTGASSWSYEIVGADGHTVLRADTSYADVREAVQLARLHHALYWEDFDSLR